MSIQRSLREWVDRAQATLTLFSDFLDEDSRERRRRYLARRLIEQVADQVRPLLRGVSFDYSGIDGALRLPEGSLAELASIFQNIFFNAYNAMLDAIEASEDPDQVAARLIIKSHLSGRKIN